MQRAVQVGHPGPQRYCQNPDCSVSQAANTDHAASKGNTAIFGLQRQALTAAFTATQPGVELYLTDHDSPRVTGATNSLGTSWVNGKDNSAIGGPDTRIADLTARATDSSLGVHRLSVEGFNQRPHTSDITPITTNSVTDDLATEFAACDGTRTSRCPATWPASQTRRSDAPKASYLEIARRLTVAGLPQGTNTFALTATDIVGNVNTWSRSNADGTVTTVSGGDPTAFASQPLRVDRDPPEAGSVRLGGAFSSLLDHGLTNSANTVDVEFYGTDALSGVQHFELDEVDSTGTSVLQTLAIADEPIGSDGTYPNNPLAAAVSLSKLEEGTHYIALRAFDAASNMTTTHVRELVIDRSGPTISLSGSMFDQRETAWSQDDPSRDLTIQATDERSGAVTVNIYNEESSYFSGTQLPSNTLVETWTPSAKVMHLGGRGISVFVQDAAGNQSSAAFRVLMSCPEDGADEEDQSSVGGELGSMCGGTASELPGLEAGEDNDDVGSTLFSLPQRVEDDGSNAARAGAGARSSIGTPDFDAVADNIHRSTYNFGKDRPEVAVHAGWVYYRDDLRDNKARVKTELYEYDPDIDDKKKRWVFVSTEPAAHLPPANVERRTKLDRKLLGSAPHTRCIDVDRTIHYRAVVDVDVDNKPDPSDKLVVYGTVSCSALLFQAAHD